MREEQVCTNLDKCPATDAEEFVAQRGDAEQGENVPGVQNVVVLAELDGRLHRGVN